VLEYTSGACSLKRLGGTCFSLSALLHRDSSGKKYFVGMYADVAYLCKQSQYLCGVRKKKQLTKFGSAGRSRLQLGFTIPAAQWFEKLRIGVFSVRYHVRVVNHATAMTQRCYLLWHNVRTDFEVGDKPTRTGSWAGLSVYRVVLGISAGLVGS